MKKIFISVIFLGIILAIIGVGYLSGNTPTQPIQSYLCSACGCTDACNGSTRCVLEYQDGKKEYYCCPHCAFPNRMWKSLHGEHIRKVTVVDFETGKTINAVGAYYLVNSNLHICCSPSIVAFQTKLQAEQFKERYGGEISHLSK